MSELIERLETYRAALAADQRMASSSIASLMTETIEMIRSQSAEVSELRAKMKWLRENVDKWPELAKRYGEELTADSGSPGPNLPRSPVNFTKGDPDYLKIPPEVECHAEGDTCHGCDHYYGKAEKCKYAPVDGSLDTRDHECIGEPPDLSPPDDSRSDRGEDYMRCLPDVCESLYPFAVAWRDTVFRSNVGNNGIIYGQENRNEIAVLDEFKKACRYLGLTGDDSEQEQSDG